MRISPCCCAAQERLWILPPARDDAALGERVRLYREDVSGEGHDVHETLVHASEKRFLFFGG